jgi:hypothetical protein
VQTEATVNARDHNGLLYGTPAICSLDNGQYVLSKGKTCQHPAASSRIGNDDYAAILVHEKLCRHAAQQCQHLHQNAD